jgi:hypothetical protein
MVCCASSNRSGWVHYASITLPLRFLLILKEEDERSALMAQLQIAYLPRPGTQERWRRFCQDVAELRPEQFAAVCQQAGITQVQFRLLQLRHSELLLVAV